MIISRTPFRISFMGGGTDLPAFYQDEEGVVVSTAINKYMHITVNTRFDSTYRLSYSKTEIVDQIEGIDHPIFRAVLKRHAPAKAGLEPHLYGGSSGWDWTWFDSSFTVGLLHALKSYLGKNQSAEDLASEACTIEIDELKEPIGKQDQYIAAYGGLRIIRFHPDGRVQADPIICSAKTYTELESSTMLFFTGNSRNASEILKEQRGNTGAKKDVLRDMKKAALRCKSILEEKGEVRAIGELLHQTWLMKKSLASKISSPKIDQWYQTGLDAGAWGGKILGAGGGGFLMFLCAPEKQEHVRQALPDLRELRIQFDRMGSRIIFVD